MRLIDDVRLISGFCIATGIYGCFTAILPDPQSWPWWGNFAMVCISLTCVIYGIHMLSTAHGRK